MTPKHITVCPTGGGQTLRTGSLVLPLADNILSECILTLFIKQNRGKIHSLKNAVCYRKDKAAGTQFLPPLWSYENVTGKVASTIHVLSNCSLGKTFSSHLG